LKHTAEAGDARVAGFDLLLTRSALTDEVDSGWQRLDEVVTALSAEELQTKLTSRDPEDPAWTIADAVLHIAAWKRNGTRVARLQAAPGSEPVDAYPPQILGIDLQAFNDALVRDPSHNRELSAVLSEHRAAHAELLEALRPLPDERLLLDGRPRLWLAPVTWHPIHHLTKDILATLG
jgi:hypothetical protein